MSVLKIKGQDGNWTEITTISGYTPIRGIDYWTEEDKQEIIDTIPTTDLTNYYTKVEIDALIGSIESQLDDINGEVI